MHTLTILLVSLVVYFFEQSCNFEASPVTSSYCMLIEMYAYLTDTELKVLFQKSTKLSFGQH